MALPIVKRFLISLDQNKFVGIFVFLVCLGGSVIFALLPDPEKPPTFYRAVGQLALPGAAASFYQYRKPTARTRAGY